MAVSLLPEPNSLPVNGLLDSRRAAAVLGVDANTFKVWATRSKTDSGGIPSLMPQPIGKLSGSVYRAEDIHILKNQLAERSLLPQDSRMKLAQRKMLGSYFTPSTAAHLMAAWAFRHRDEIVLEPSLGDGQFLHAVAQVARAAGWPRPDMHAAELDPTTAHEAATSGAITHDRLHLGDFLKAQFPPVDVVIGNPPYVRLRALEADQVSSAQTAMKKTLGQLMDPAGSLWMPFVSKSASHLKLGGRMALVLPLDFTYVRYARPLWRFLAQSFGSLRVLRFRERVFPDILQNVLILLADDKGRSTDFVEYAAAPSLDDFDQESPGVRLSIEDIVGGRRVFQTSLLSADSAGVFQELELRSGAAKDRIKFNIGYVSGNKSFFHPSQDTVARYEIPNSSLRPSAVSTRQLSRSGLYTSMLDASDHLWLPGEEISPGERRYIDKGESAGIDLAYKCRIRSPWYSVPGVKTPDVLLTVFSDRPSLYVNDAGWVASNSVLCGYLHSGEGAVSFASSWYSALTLLSSELEVHSLGGGVMIAVPKEADSIRLLDAAATNGRDLTRLSSHLSGGQTEAAYRSGDEFLGKIVGKEGIELLWTAIEDLGRWRRASA